MITTNENICMPSTINYSTRFVQNDLLNHMPNDKNLMGKLTQQLKSISNITYACKTGACQGLSHIFAAYEMNGLGAESLHQLKNCLNPVIPSTSAYKEVNKCAEQAYSKCISNLLAERCTDIFDIQINQYQYCGYYNLYIGNDIVNMTPKPENMTNIEYIIQYLEKNSANIHSKNRDYWFQPDITIEKNIAHELYSRIESGVHNPTPNKYKSAQSLYNKINQKKAIMPIEAHSFIKEIYAYCMLHYASETALFNLNSGITMDNRYPPLSLINIEPFWENISFKKLEYLLTKNQFNKQDIAILYSSNDHAMAICGKYYPQKEKYLFSFFEPNYGLIQIHDKNEFIQLLSQITTPHPTLPFSFSLTYPFIKRTKPDKTICHIRKLQKTRTHSKEMKLPQINNKELQAEIKKQLTENKISIDLDKSAKLIFDEYSQENNKLTMKLKKEGNTFTIYSTLCDIHSTIELITNSINKVPLLTTRDICINSLGKISYIPK